MLTLWVDTGGFKAPFVRSAVTSAVLLFLALTETCSNLLKWERPKAQLGLMARSNPGYNFGVITINVTKVVSKITAGLIVRSDIKCRYSLVSFIKFSRKCGTVQDWSVDLPMTRRACQD